MNRSCSLLPLLLSAACSSGPAPAPSSAPASAPGGASAATRAGALAIGSGWVKADVPMKNVDGEAITLTQAAGERGTLVVFTCNHCPWAKAWESRITDLGNRFGEHGIRTVAINPNDPEAYPEDAFVEMRDRHRAAGMTFPYVVDETGEVARAYGATKTPEVFLFDADRKLVYHGAVDDNANAPDEVEQRWLEDALTAVSTGRTVAVTETKALGCSIKYRP